MISSVERKRTFTDFRHEGLRLRHGVIRLNHLPQEKLSTGAASPQVAFAIGRRFGNAVDRNRGRRRLRAAFVEVWRDLTPARRNELAGAYLASASPAVLRAPFTQLLADVEACFDQITADRPTTR
ncbi:MAG: ribonuclease P protein component [Actinomycetota bacterium]